MSNKLNSGALFTNKKTNEKQPDYRGTANVNGKDMEISAWINISKEGTKYMSISFQEPYKKPEQFDARKYAENEANKMFSRDIEQEYEDDDDLPF